jgi:hypothetical protein
MGRPWFAPKAYGYGFNPVTWEGWLVTLVFVLLVIATTGYLNPDGRILHLFGADRVPLLRDLRPNIFEVIVALLVEIAAFLAIGRWKCSGPWTWRDGSTS